MLRFIIPISGKDSLATAIVQRTQFPTYPYEYIYNRTGTELPEIELWLDRVETRLDITITRIGASLVDIIEDIGMLPSMHARFCTRKAKIIPMEDFINGDDTVIYYGLRADENRIGYDPTAKPHIRPVYPLIQLGLGINDVYKILDYADLMPPTFYWGALATLVEYELPKPVSTYNLPRWLHTHLFAWRSRMNCYHCFFQRSYEWIGLYYHYPELFAKAVNMENTIGGKDFTWIPRESLTELINRRHDIMARRARKVAQIIEKTDKEDPDLLTMFSCGLFCGK